jgi:serine/threonine-protein kinase
LPSVDPDGEADSSQETAAAPPEKPRAPAAAGRFAPGALLLGRYRIVSPLGKGGMGEVYRADDLRLGQPVALKFLSAAVAADSGRLERLVEEVRIGRQISHPNVCRLYDIAEADGHHFLVMEYVDGEDLASLLRRIGRLPGGKALEIARDVCAGLAAAHDKGVIHRDLKPANVMIDGKGHARIADFGLAALAERGGPADLSGTPAYMAPEQLSGEGTSLRSDVFALGLVFSEMLTGRRVLEAKSLQELRALHAQAQPLRPTSGAQDVDPAFERVVVRCLARDPKERPESARAVLASLPGGDPLHAAVLAGETPSPEMVAAAAKVGALSPAAAWPCLLSGLAGLVLLTALAQRTSLVAVAPLPKPPDALVVRAREVAARLGYREAPADSAHGFEPDRALLDHMRRERPSPDWWEAIRTSRPGAYRFWYRQSPRRLWSRSWIETPPWLTPAELGRVTRIDPPPLAPGMIEVVLDAEGRLTSFTAVPPRFDAAPVPGAEPEWAVAFAEAGFDRASLRPSPSRWAAPVDTDGKAAWDGESPELPGVPIHFEAASYRGRPVHFEVLGPWVQPAREAAGSDRRDVATSIVFAVFILAVGVAAAVLVRRNLRLQRGDRRGALRLAAFSFATVTLAGLARADHTSSLVAEHHLIIQIVSQSLFLAMGSWIAYMALEPAVRRRWPDTLISWSRLLAGRFGDPLVGRDALVGILAGLLAAALQPLARLVPAWLGGTPLPPVSHGAALSAPWPVAYFFLLSPAVAMTQSLLALFFYYVLHALVGRARVAWLLFFLFWMPLATGLAEDLVVAGATLIVFFAIWVFVLRRLGLLSSSIFLFTFYTLLRTPLTLDWSAWYAGRSFAVLGFFVALLAFAFHASLGGKPLFGRRLLED